MLTRDGCAQATSDDLRQVAFMSRPAPYCYCSQERCVRAPAEPASCSSDRDCGLVERGGVVMPIRISPPRTRELLPCVSDGDRIPTCDSGTCTIIIYGC
jgi:hypothetical protein